MRTQPVAVSEPAVVVTPPPPVAVAPPPVVVVSPPPAVIMPPVLVGPPTVVLVPGTQVYTVPSATFDVFVYGGRYYGYHHGAWFVAPRHGAAWTALAVDAVPPAVRAVPVRHYKIPPGQERKMERAEERGDRCPPGQAKKWQC